jgi:hypothetical protein
MKKRRRKKVRVNKLPCVIDECISPKEEKWKIENEDDIYSLEKLDLLSTKDKAISTALESLFPGGKIILTANKRPDKQGDYFISDSKTSLVKFSADLNTTELRQQHYKKFRKMIKNDSKLLGSVVTLTKTRIIYKKGNKLKNYKYKNFII